MQADTPQFSITHLRCEYLENPLGIDVPTPYLSWKLYGKRRGLRQTAYQIHCSTHPINFKHGTLTWDTGRVESSDSIQIPYRGNPLGSRERIYWRVQVWDERGEKSEWTQAAWWEMGLLQESDWSARWVDPEGKINPKELQPVAQIRKRFEILKPFKQARMYATAHGVYESFLNGQRVGDAYFTPGITVYEHRMQYQVYDITEYLHVGINSIGIMVGDGWWRGSTAAENVRNRGGKRLAFLGQIEIVLNNGEILRVISDSTWKSTSEGAFRHSDLKIGDHFDGTKLIDGWLSPEFDDTEWKRVKEVKLRYDHLIASTAPPVREKERFHPEILHTPDGSTILDFTQNIAGYIDCKFRNLPKGHRVELEYGEVLDKVGNFTQSNFISDKDKVKIQRDTYIHPGFDYQFKNKFSLKGFRYVRIKGYPNPIDPQNFTAIALYSDLEQTGDFQCSNPLINQLVKNTQWSQKSNFLEIPTDCPTRERNGWTGDAQIFGYTGSLLMNIAPIYAKWIKDVAAVQKSNGNLLSVVPYPPKWSKIAQGAAGWGDAILIIPSTLNSMFGEQQLISDIYENAKRWVEYERKRASKTRLYYKLKKKYWFGKNRKSLKYLWDKAFQFGEWLEAELSPEEHSKEIKNTVLYGKPEMATAYYAYSSRMLSQWAEKLGKDADAEKYADISTKAKEAYKIFSLTNGLPISKRQARHVRPVALKMVEGEYAGKIVTKLNNLIDQNDFHLGTGFLSTPFLLPVLSEFGYLDTAYKILEQTTRPSWLYQVTKGATTIWESWHGITENGELHGSHNHYSYGAVVSWLFDTVAGIRYDPSVPAYKHIYIKPRPGGSLTHVRCEFNSMYGLIRSSWKISGGSMKFNVTIPPNTTANITLPNAQKDSVVIDDDTLFEQMEQVGLDVSLSINSGNYEFEYQLKNNFSHQFGDT